jgi:hypothetical protein
VVATDPLSAEQERTLKNALNVAKWWHWLPNFWLIVDEADSLSADSIRDEIHKIDVTKRAMVIEVDHKIWSACTKKDTKGRDMVDWIRNTWDKPQ